MPFITRAREMIGYWLLFKCCAQRAPPATTWKPLQSITHSRMDDFFLQCDKLHADGEHEGLSLITLLTSLSAPETSRVAE